ncbi:MAG TPA: sensor histidine kinase, partial [Chitinophagaceae bacterium]|nr:sensor histidine kinase [Chitinophagaceae bacterium]
MLEKWFNWRTILLLTAIIIVGSSIFYSNYLAKKIAVDERSKMEQWAEAVRSNSNPAFTETNLSSKILTENSVEIPILLLTEKDSLLDFRNIDSTKILQDKNYLKEKINQFKKLNQPIEWINPLDSTQKNKVFYGESKLLKEVRYFPMIQLLVAGLFVLII